MEVTWEPRSCQDSMALLGLGYSQGFSERPLKKMGMASKKLDFQLVWVLPGESKKQVTTCLFGSLPKVAPWPRRSACRDSPFC